jgi:MFS family permease
MASSATPGSQIGPLNPGDVVSAAIQLYRDRFKTFIALALYATLWIAGGVLGLVLAIALLAGLFGVIGGDIMAILGGLIGFLVGLAALVYGSAKYYLISSVIGRLCFRDLIHDPETSLQARRQVAPKLAQFLLLGILLGLAYIAAYLLVGLAALIAGGSVGFLTAGIFAALINPTAGNIIGIVLGGMLGLALLLVALVWIVSKLFIADVVLAVEPQREAPESIGRSWTLTNTAIWRIQVVFLATFIIQLPIIAVTNYIPSILLQALPLGTVAYALFYTLSLVLSLIGSIFVLPLWQAVKGVLYYDLRSRREGLDLELRNRPGESPA